MTDRTVCINDRPPLLLIKVHQSVQFISLNPEETSLTLCPGPCSCQGDRDHDLLKLHFLPQEVPAAVVDVVDVADVAAADTVAAEDLHENKHRENSRTVGRGP